MNELKRKDVMMSLECCAVYANCNGCPHFNDFPEEDCHYKVMLNALYLLREDRAEIEKLTINMNAYGLTAKNLAEDFADYQADVQMEIADARAASIDEFLAKAKAMAREIGDLKPFVLVEYLEEIARGMKNEV